MSSKQEDLSQLKEYIKGIDNEVTMILQSLQWDRKHLLEYKPKTSCKYNSNHKIQPENMKEHEENCKLISQGYVKEDDFLPDAFDTKSNTYLKLTSDDIKEIINYASKTDPMFREGDANMTSELELEPLTFERLQATYTTDERRAIYDVVINAAPSVHDLSDLALPRAADGPSQSKPKSKQEVLAELRDMRRRRARYRVARSRNYSHTLRGLIDAQMEMYAEENLTKSKLHKDTRGKKYRADSYKSVKNSEDDITKYNKDFSNERSNYGEKRRKRDYSADGNSRDFENKRQNPSEEKRQYNERNGTHDRQRDSHKRERDNSKYEVSIRLERNGNDKGRERNRYTSRSKDRDGDSERDGLYHSKSSERNRIEAKKEKEYNEYEKRYLYRNKRDEKRDDKYSERLRIEINRDNKYEKEYSHERDGRYHDKSSERHRTEMKRENVRFDDEYETEY